MLNCSYKGTKLKNIFEANEAIGEHTILNKAVKHAPSSEHKDLVLK